MRYSFLLVLIVFTLVRRGTPSTLSDCPANNVFSTGGYSVDLSSLRGTWDTVYIEGTDLHSDITVPRFYNISLFTPFTNDQCKGHHVCYTETFEAFHILGKHESCKYRSEDKIISLVYDYDAGVYGSGNVTINLICGTTLGVPEVLEGDPRNHVVELMWITSAACKTNTDKTTPHETKCYNLKPTIDRESGIQAEFVDFNGLIRDAGYEAMMAERPGLAMNVSICRPIKSNDDCNGANVCLYKGDSHINMKEGHSFPLPLAFISDTSSESAPHYESGTLSMIFPVKKDNVKCSGESPFVKVRFFCPKGDEALGPYIEYIDNDLCVTIIVWNTMHACDITTVQSTNLKLNTPQGTHFDLRGLPEVTITDPHPTKTYQYTIHTSTQGSLNEGCQDDNPAPIHVIQAENGTAKCRSLGEGTGKLRYIDNVLTLTYTNGDTCSDGFARTSIITFVCPDNVVGGAKHCDSSNASNCVSFTFESHCLYEFEWVTNVACAIDSTSSSSCRFTINKIDYNLGLLTEDYRSTYAAIATGDEATECYLINPCGNVALTELTNLTSAQYCNQKVAPEEFCDQSSICRIPKNGSPKGESYGKFHLDNSTSIHSIVKDVVSVATIPVKNSLRAGIQYVCKPGTLATSPVFISHEAGTAAEFHWYTFAACPQGVSVGSDCMVTQPSSGFTFNLSSLSGQVFNFTDKIHNFNYSIAVCNKLPEGQFEGSCASNSAICQHTSATSHKSAGQMNTSLIYADSALKLHYMDGQKCSSGDVRHTTVIFTCNPDVHQATILNVTEIEHCSYVVEMETKLACPPAYRSSECVYFSSNGDSYDLTPLERTTGNWEARGSDGSVYLINVCRPLDLMGVGQCNPLSAVCKIPHTACHDPFKGNCRYKGPNMDLGLASSASFGPPPKSADSHVTLVLNYTHSSTSDNDCPTIYTSIEFMCNRSAPTDAGPRHLSGGGSANPCEYLFLWETRVVCPIEKEEVKACNITDKATGYTFDLNPLTTHHDNLYTVAGSDGNNYTLTLCAALSESECESKSTAVCQLASGQHHSSGTYSSMELIYIDGSLSLYYRGGEKCSKGDVRTTQIDFLCDRLAGEDYFGFPKFVSESSHCHYLFEWATPLACPPTDISCVAEGGKYNLKPLLSQRNWYVSGIKGHQYVIGGCQSVDSTSIPECAPSTNVGACLYSPGSGTAGDVLGYLTGDLVEVAEGHLRLSYHNGKMCPSEGRRSVVNIHFHCKPNSGAGSPVLASSGCVTEITWDTQYACVQDNSTHGWSITNPATGQTFDLSKITKVITSDHKGFHSNYRYSVGLAGSTVPCGDQKDVIICQTSISSGHTFVLSRKDKNTELQIVGGKIQFTTQNGDQCHHHSQINRKVTVYFEYDPRGDSLMVLPEQGCEYSFIVFTPLVKEKEAVIGTQCYVENFPDLEWFTTYPTPPILVESGRAKVYFSVCSPISSSNQEANDGFQTCHDVSSACYVKGSEVLNLGRPSVHSPLVVSPDGNAVQLTYGNGDPCPNTNKRFITKILLVCSTVTGGVPEVTHFNKSSCEAIIVWRSPHACPRQIPITPVSDSVCKIMDPADGTLIDLQPLTTDGTHIQTTDGDYTLGLCGQVTKDAGKCNSVHAGVCHKDEGRWMKMADANHTISLVSHSPHAIDFQYSTGESCDNHRTWSVNIHIYCSNKYSSDKPFFESSSDCELRFRWPSSALCLTQVEGCYVSYPDNTILDLEALVSRSWKGTYLGNGERLGEFNMSVCRNLNPTINEGSHCFPGPAGICFQPDVSKNEYKNLGYMSAPPNVTNDGSVVLHYSKGDGCGGGKNISADVYLKCPVTDYESPPKMRASSSECHYEVDWTTQAACKHNKKESGSCIVTDSGSGVQYDFKPLAKQFTFQDNVTSSSYSVCLCPNEGSCNTGIVNTTGGAKVNLGVFHQLVIYSNAGPQFDFIGGDKCPGNNKYSSTIMMFCDRSIKEEKGKFFYEEGLSLECHKYFSWWTPVACTSPQISCIIQQPFYDFTPIYPPNGSWVAKDERNHEEYLINICGPVHIDSTSGCSGDTAICHKKSDGSYHDLAFASTQTLHINSNHNPEVHFNSVVKCSGSKYYTVVIEMVCGLEGLKFKGTDKCKYQFDWHTTYACQESERLHTQSTCNDYVDKDNVLNTFYPKQLLADSGYHVSSNINGIKYHINLCGDESDHCGEGVAVCQTNGDNKVQLGTTDSLTLTFDSYWMMFSFTGSGGSSIITVECADADSHDSPEGDLDKLFLENEFHNSDKKQTVYFRMYSKKACKFENPPSSVPPTSSPGGSPGHPTGGSSKVNTAIIIIILVVVLIVVIVITIIAWKKERREYVMRKLLSIVSPKANEPVKYIRARTNDTEASLMEEESSSSSGEEEEEPLGGITTRIAGTQDGAADGGQGTIDGSGSTTTVMKLKKRTKKKADQPPFVAEYKDEEEEHLSDEELLNL